VKFKKRNSKVIGRVSKKKKKYRHILVKMGPKFKNYDKTLKVTSCKMYNNDGSLPYIQQLFVVPYSEPNYPNQILTLYFLKNVLLLSASLKIRFPMLVFLHCSLNEIIFSSTHSKYTEWGHFWVVNGGSDGQNIPSSVWNQPVHYRTHNSPVLYPILNQIIQTKSLPYISWRTYYYYQPPPKFGLPCWSSFNAL
jgi:hypothetical protein